MAEVENMTGIARRIVLNLLNISANLQRVGNRITGEYGLKQQQFVVLNEIVVNGEVHQKQIVGELLYEKSNVSKIVKKLKALSLITVSPLPEDRRITILSATGTGKKVWAECMEKFDVWNKNWIKPLTSEEATQTFQILERLKKLL